MWADFCAGHYDVVIDSVFPLEQAAEAQEKMVSNDFFGKILLAPCAERCPSRATLRTRS